MQKPLKPIILLILDGWGVDNATPYNAITTAKTPQWDAWWKTMPHGLLNASGESVGLPKDQMGNSEVGHMHMGAGRLILQDLTRIQSAIDSGAYEAALMPFLKSVTARLHVIGLLSKGGVHSHEDHLLAFLAICQKHRIHNIVLHLFLDGRDTPPRSAKSSLEKLQAYASVARIASLCGRYYAMDRDNRWDRVSQAYQLLTAGVADHHFKTPIEALEAHYAAGHDDEFVPPTLIGEAMPMRDSDSLFCFNFRADRVRQLMHALVSPAFHRFERKVAIHFQSVLTMTQYEAGLPVDVLFQPVPINNSLSEVLSKAQKKQLKLAETEKYAHVTFFFNGGEEVSYPGEARVLIPSPKVATYDLSPHMSAALITEKLVEAIHALQYDVIVCNYANADMVGHTGDMQAATEAIAFLDTCLAQVGQAVLAVNGGLLITADHGNAEVMYDEKTKQPHTAHTSHLVPFIFVGNGFEYRGGIGNLSDIAPTILALLGISQPKEMTGMSLLRKDLGKN